MYRCGYVGRLDRKVTQILIERWAGYIYKDTSDRQLVYS
jgi:hypothetical protein